ncbi:hypothetical protein PCANC_17372 [Puccinia coronata f. sp. avenae]|uniref:Uncharacterized protein n=1 Tax=Puccinia coronata f. sp. avenae TaxID=200324 RepID=A0A2N5UZV2_9BASI|nr:hypothetical protein PCANC_17372 [Puccinia coronata f. sp. avenae]
MNPKRGGAPGGLGNSRDGRLPAVATPWTYAPSPLRPSGNDAMMSKSRLAQFPRGQAGSNHFGGCFTALDTTIHHSVQQNQTSLALTCWHLRI